MAKLKTINIKGKEYVEVNERLKYFRENHPEHSLITEIIQCTDEHCVIKAIIAHGDKVIATGHAHEIKSASFINKTSYVEVCETSAWGRALANFGIGIVSGKKKLTSSQFDAMMKAIKDGESLVVKQRMENYSMTEDQRKILMNEINK